MNIDNPGVQTIELSGRIDALTSPELEIQLCQLKEVDLLILDFRRVDYISSAGLRVMLILAGDLKKKGGELLLFGLNESVHEIFVISGFDTIIRVFDTYDDINLAFNHDWV